MSKAAVFYDLENCLEPGLDIGDIYLKLTAALSDRNVILQRAYANFAKGYAKQIEGIHRYGIQPVQVFGAKPNAVDFELSLDALKLGLTHSFLRTIVVVSNDGDFLPLFRHLRELQIEVIAVLTKEAHHPMLPTNTDRVLKLYQKTSVKPTQPVDKPVPVAPQTSVSPSAKVAWPAFRKLKPNSPSVVFGEALEKYLGQLQKQRTTKVLLTQEGLLLSVIGNAIKQVNPEFTPQMYGFSSFSRLLLCFLEQTEWGLFRAPGQKNLLRLCRHGQTPQGYIQYSPDYQLLDAPLLASHSPDPAEEISAGLSQNS
ncbi:MAG: hypothetical protein CVV27_06950 [Candidatus Melainabacteria bacterium HGW-Melainabacteria-1]|nr:MAG: hypothetical protein CVV27_06950 [Candidatus Melainabacteria bacterium HGW-Melainabacteria-1]